MKNKLQINNFLLIFLLKNANNKGMEKSEKNIDSFYERIKLKTKEKNISQIELCEKCNINLQSHRGRISRKILPDVFDVVAIAQILNTSVEYLVTGNEENPLQNEVMTLKEKIERARQILA